ncbi:MAG TPA: AraC family transcriptional regulator [Kofleriaceae bacterium]
MAPRHMGLIVDRDADALNKRRVYPSPALVLPLETTVMTLRVARTERRLDRATFALVPARVAHEIEVPAVGTVIVVSLLLEQGVCAAAVRDYAPHVDARGFAEVVSQVRWLSRTRWVDELVHRFVFERELCNKSASRAARFLEAEIAKETYFLVREQLEQRTRDSVLFEGDALGVRAREWIEAHLFEPFRLDELLRHCHASESTLLRACRRELGAPPLVYARRRRLEESLQLLETGRYTVTEIATRIGYDNPSAFAAAFRDQFGVAPSSIATAPGRVRLPAHGMPPQVNTRR